MPARNTYECTEGHRLEYFRKHGQDKPKRCTHSDIDIPSMKCEAPLEIVWDAEPGDYFGTMGLINRL